MVKVLVELEYEDENAIPASLKTASTRQGDDYVVSKLPSGWGLEDVKGLRGQAERHKEEIRTLKEFKAQFDGMDPTSARSSIERLKTIDAELANKAEEREKAIHAKYAGELEQLREKADKATNEMRHSKLVSGSSAAISKLHGKHTPLMLAIERHAKWGKDEKGSDVLQFVGDDGEVIRGNDGKAVDVTGFLTSLKADPEWASSFEYQGAGGAGTTHATGGAGRGGQQTNLSPEARIAAHHARTMSS